MLAWLIGLRGLLGLFRLALRVWFCFWVAVLFVICLCAIGLDVVGMDGACGWV